MTERTYRETKIALIAILGGIVAVLCTSDLAYISVGDHVYLDLSMIPAAVLLMLSGYTTSVVFGISWGVLSCVTHPLPAYDSHMYILILLSQVVFSLSIVYAKRFGCRYKGKYNVNYVVLFAIITHSLVFDLGAFATLKWFMHEPIPVVEIFVKVGLTSMFFYMAVSLISKQLHQVHLSNGVKRSNS